MTEVRQGRVVEAFDRLTIDESFSKSIVGDNSDHMG